MSGIGIDRRGRARGAAVVAVAMWVVAGSGAAVTTAAAESAAEARLAALESEVRSLRDQLAQAEPQQAPVGGEQGATRLAELERKVDILGSEISRLQLGEAAPAADESVLGFGKAASKVYRTSHGVSVGGYGEMLYERFDSERDNGAPANTADRLDFVRAIVYVGYRFDARWLFNSELEFEHASTEHGGSVAVELAQVEFRWREQLGFRGGMMLVPMGLTNELHEPTLILGTRRTETERRLIPSTWRENGIGLYGEAGPLTYRSYLINGLNARGFDAAGIREGRQWGARAFAEDFAWVGRIDYQPLAGLAIGASAYAGDSGQDLKGADGGQIDVGTLIYEAHASWSWRGLRARGLAARVTLRDVAALNEALELSGNKSIGESMWGGYVEAGFDVLSLRGSAGQASITPFVRWERLNTQASVPAGYQAAGASTRSFLTIGLEYAPLPQVVFKVDYANADNDAGTGLDQIGAAIGYIF
ncbi:MAG: hypothetical protein HYV63_25825 [Candidatus Schekmanbacteria bacterium]|nr:hypothetical protein [Candidatus Schekmanbacteria bacterium]